MILISRKKKSQNPSDIYFTKNHGNFLLSIANFTIFTV